MPMISRPGIFGLAYPQGAGGDSPTSGRSVRRALAARLWPKAPSLPACPARASADGAPSGPRRIQCEIIAPRSIQCEMAIHCETAPF